MRLNRLRKGDVFSIKNDYFKIKSRFIEHHEFRYVVECMSEPPRRPRYIIGGNAEVEYVSGKTK